MVVLCMMHVAVRVANAVCAAMHRVMMFIERT